MQQSHWTPIGIDPAQHDNCVMAIPLSAFMLRRKRSEIRDAIAACEVKLREAVPATPAGGLHSLLRSEPRVPPWRDNRALSGRVEGRGSARHMRADAAQQDREGLERVRQGSGTGDCPARRANLSGKSEASPGLRRLQAAAHGRIPKVWNLAYYPSQSILRNIIYGDTVKTIGGIG